MKYTVGISDMKVTTGMDDELVTYSLGSCVGVTLYDPEAGVGGMIHCMLPLGKADPQKAQSKPAMFVDSGLTALLDQLHQAGANNKRIIAKLAGASSLLDEKGTFKIGKRNHTVARKFLWKNGIMVEGEDVFGSISRTMFFYMNSGVTTIKSQGTIKEL